VSDEGWKLWVEGWLTANKHQVGRANPVIPSERPRFEFTQRHYAGVIVGKMVALLAFEVTPMCDVDVELRQADHSGFLNP
jgi:hypothetical protein